MFAKADRRVRILHVAPEFALARQFRVALNIEYVTADLDVSFIPGIGIRPDHVTSITDMPFQDSTFDLLVCNHVLEHVPEDEKAISEIHRVLRPGGQALITVPVDESATQTAEDVDVVDPEERTRLYGAPGHVRMYAMDLVDRLRRPGLEVEVRRPSEGMSPAQVTRWGLLLGEPLFIAVKARPQGSN